MVKVLYNIAIEVFSLILYALGWVKPKVKKRINALKSQQISEKHRDCILIHCASAGEYEQISPVIKFLQKEYPNQEFVISFFSPSGIEWLERLGSPLPSYYLPLDQYRKIKIFVEELNPKFVLIAKNELWFNFISILEQKNIPHFLISASFKKNHFALKNKYFLERLKGFTHIFLISDQDSRNINGLLDNTSISGDTRIDRIINKSLNVRLPDFFREKSDQIIVILASIHKEDLFTLSELKNSSKYQFIIVPHDIDKQSVDYFINNSSVDIDILSKTEKWGKNPILVDEIGILAGLYKISDVVYVGGGFGQGIHNILEPAIFENIIFIGPKNHTFVEARDLLAREAVFEIRKDQSFLSKYETFGESQIKYIKRELNQYFQKHKDVSSIITENIIKQIEATK